MSVSTLVGKFWATISVVGKHQYPVGLMTRKAGWYPWGAGEIRRHPEVETLLVTRDNRTEVMRKVSNWLMEGG